VSPCWYQRRRRAGALTACQAEDVRAEDRPETLGALAHDHAPAADDGAREPPDGVEERAHVDLRLARERVQHGTHGEMGVNERVDLDVTPELCAASSC